MLAKILAAIERLPRSIVIELAILMMLEIGVFDAYTGFEIRIMMFYAVPIAFVAWRMGATAGFVASAACTVTWIVANTRGFGASTWIITNPIGAGTQVSTAAWIWTTLSVFVSLAIPGITIGRLRDLVDKLRKLATHDALTGLLTRRAFEEELIIEVARAFRHERPLSLLYLDLDNLKQVNDEHGHAAGDRVIRQFAKVLAERLRTTDLGGRLGGDEFAALLPETSAEGASVLAHDLLENFQRESNSTGVPASCSIGVATFMPPPNDAEAVLHVADELMYEVKKDGKGAIRARTYVGTPSGPEA